MRLAEEVDKYALTIDQVLRGSRWHKAADIVHMAFQDIKNLDIEVPQLRRRIKELEAELLTFRPAPQPVERDEYGTHIKWTGD